MAERNIYLMKQSDFISIQMIPSSILIEAIRSGNIDVIRRELSNYTFADFRYTRVVHHSSLFEALKSNTTITSIHLGGNEVNLLGLAEVLKFNTTLTSLNLEDCEIEDISVLTEALETNTTLTSLDLSYNKIKDISNLSRVLEINPTLTHVYLRNNEIRDISSLTRVTEVNTSLTHLYVGDKIEDVSSFLKVLKTNSVLKRIYIDGNGITKEQMCEMQMLSARNQNNEIRKSNRLDQLCWSQISDDRPIIRSLPPIIVSSAERARNSADIIVYVRPSMLL